MNDDCRCPSCLPLSVYRCYRYGGWCWVVAVFLSVLSLAMLSRLVFITAMALAAVGTTTALTGVALEESSLDAPEDDR